MNRKLLVTEKEGDYYIMLIPHLYLNGRCREAITLYTKAFNAEVKVLIPNSTHDSRRKIIHAEISIHGQRVMMNDIYGKSSNIEREKIELVVIFNTVEELKKSYEIMKEGSHILTPMTRTDYSPCVIEFWDKYGISWGFMVGES